MDDVHILRDDIAVVGWACRLPGASSISELWSLLLEGRCAITSVPEERYSLQRYGHPRRQERGKAYTWAAGVLDDVWGFDPAVFGISPREAEQMDPQQRILLQLAWEALEDAGIRPSAIAGSDVGVYVGASMSEYAHNLYGDLAAADSHFATGMSLAVIANRISYAFDLHGPSITVDTACSSSLVALNQAVEALRSGRVDTAIVGGVNILASPAPFVLFSQAMMLSPTGLCRAFSADADGFVRAEGGVILVLRKAALAASSGNPMHGVIIASDVNSDGHTHGISLPSEAAQEQLLTRVYSRAGLDPNRLAFVEAHGTGTQAGDPVEAKAIGRSVGHQRTQPLPIGSIKTNIGHLEPASGLAGIVKALLALNHGVLPPTLHYGEPNPNIPFADLNLTVCHQPLLLSNADQRCAGVNSFGFGGTNAHVIVGAGRQSVARRHVKAAPAASCFAISANSRGALNALAQNYRERLADLSDEETSIVASAAAHRRDPLSHRLVVASAAKARVVDALEAFARDAEHPLLTVGEAVGTGLPVAFVYSGNGSQWTGMGLAAYRNNSVFRAQFDEIDRHFVPLAGWSLAEELASDQLAKRLVETSVAQPLIFAIQSAATAALRKRGLHPTAVLGHSVGEVAAGEAAGVLDLRTAVKIIYYRSKHQEIVRGHGRMAAVLAARERIEPLLQSVGDVEIAALNSPRALTVSGPTEALSALSEAARAQGIAVLDLDLDYPFHSRLMMPIESVLVASLRDIAPREGDIPFISTVTAAVLPGARLNAHYWWRNIREPVQFLPAIQEAAALGIRCFVEIGPRGMLLKHIADSVEEVAANFATLSVLGTSDRDNDPIPGAIAKAIVAGAQIEADAVFGTDPGGGVSLPSYPWQQQRFHYTPTTEAVGVVEGERHPLVGARYTPDALEWHNHIDTLVLPELADHKLGEQVLLPGTAFLEMSIYVARQWLGCESVVIADFEILKALDLSKGQTSEVMTRVSPASNTIEIFSRPRLSNAGWVLNSRSKMLRGGPHASIPVPARDERHTAYGSEFLYRLSAANGLPYGPAFQLARDIKATRGNDLITVELVPSSDDRRYVLDPVRLDSSTHGLILVFPDVDAEKRGVAYIPVRVDETMAFRHGSPQRAVIEIVSKNERAIVANYYISDRSGELIAILWRARCQAVAVRRGNALEAAGLIELPRLLDGSFTGETGVASGTDAVLSWLRSHDALAREVDASEATRLIEGWAIAAAYEIASALADDARIAPDVLEHTGRLATALRPWFLNLLHRLEAAGLAQRSDGDWIIAQDALLPTSASVIQLLAQDQPSRAGEILIAGAVSGWIARINTDRSLSPLVEPVLSNAVRDFFATTSPQGASAGDMLSRLLEGLDILSPPARSLRVLQIGSAPVPGLLAALGRGAALRVAIYEPDRHRLEKMRPTIAKFGNATFIETAGAIAAQGYDLIVSAEGLHQRPAELTFAALAKALAPHGLLLAIEPAPSLFRDLAFGLDPQWFDAGMAEFPVGRLGSPAVWEADIKSAGFAAGRAIDISLSAGPACLIVGEAPAASRSPASQTPAAARRSVTIVDQTDARELELTASLARLLRAAGSATRLVTELTADDPAAAPDIVVHFRKTMEDISGPAESVSARCFDMKACADSVRKKGSTLWFVFFGALNHPTSRVRPVEAAAWAFARTIANEYPHLDVRRIDVVSRLSPQLIAERLRDMILATTDETELQIDGHSVRAVRVESARRMIDARMDAAAPSLCLFRQSGPLRRLQWRPVERPLPSADQVEIEVEATGVNFRDLMWTLSLLPDEILENGLSGPTMGLECTGRVARVGAKVRHLIAGDRVAALTASGFANYVTVPAAHVVKLPASIPSEAGATIPVAFFTAYYALIRLAQLRREEWVLIHGGAGGVGLAAIQIAQVRGAQIIATAGSPAKRDLLRALGVAHVLDSRSTAFADEVRQITGAGVDIVLNSLAGEAMERSLACLRPFGRFIELGKRDYVGNTHVGLRPFRRNLSYFGVDMDQLMASRPDLCEKLYAEVMRQFETGALAPLPYSVFSADRVADAFELMQQSGHIGKIVVRAPTPALAQVTAKPFAFRSDGTHLITGAFGGFGLEIARWLVEKGARHLVMIGRQGPASPPARALLDEFARRGISVLHEACDVSDFHALERLFTKAKSTMPPLAGVIHAAMVLEDTTLANLDADSMRRVLAPKVVGADNLNTLCRRLKLDYFVLFSTLVTLIGNAGQGNYVAANAFMEGLARRRRQEGLPALAVGWGPIADVGVLVRKQLVESSIQKLSGVRGMTAREGLELMAQALAQPPDDIDLAVITIAPNDGGFGGSHLAVLRSPTYAAITPAGGGQATDAAIGIDVPALLDQHGREAGRRRIADSIAAQLARVLHARAEDISRIRPLGEIGLDSLMALELAMSLEATFGASVSISGSVGHLTVSGLADEVIAQCGGDRTREADLATVIAERHVGQVGEAHIGTIKQILSDTAQPRKVSSIAAKRYPSG